MQRKIARWISVVMMISSPMVLVVSCLPEPIPLTGLEQVQPQIVVWTQIVPDEGLVVFLTKTFSALDFNEDSDLEEVLAAIAVTDATVVLTGPEQVDTLFALGVGAYGGVPIPFRKGDDYHLEVTSATLGKVTAQTRVLPQVSFDSIHVDLYFNGYGDSLAQVTHRFTDPVGKNWYMLNVLRVRDLQHNLINQSIYTHLLTDTAFEGRIFGETFRAYPRDYVYGDTVEVVLSNISEEYYKFQDMRGDQRYNFIEYLSEPVNYPSNVAGGKGFFNLYIPDIRFFVLEWPKGDSN